MQRLEVRKVWRRCSQPVGKVVSALSLISHLSLLGPDALADQCEHLPLRTQMEETLEARIPQELGLLILNERTGGNGEREAQKKEP